jgi:hypothetical protein
LMNVGIQARHQETLHSRAIEVFFRLFLDCCFSGTTVYGGYHNPSRRQNTASTFNVANSC